MNICRLALITLSLALLVACGGGGGTAVTPSTGGGGGPTMPQLQPLPAVLVANTDQTRTLVGGTAPPNLSSAEIGRTIRTIAGNADTLLYDVDGATSVMCDRTMCNYDLNEIIHIVSVDEYSSQTLGEVEEDVEEGLELIGHNENNEAVMTDRGVTIGQRRVAARVNTEAGVVILEYQMYGGWNEDNHFGIERAANTGGNNPGIEVRTYSFGDASGTRPTATASWNGVMVGANLQGHVIHGDMAASFDINSPNEIRVLEFSDIINLDTGGEISRMRWLTIPLIADGTFESPNGDIKGTFYGTNHEEMGGIFNRNNIIGAFGSKK